MRHRPRRWPNEFVKRRKCRREHAALGGINMRDPRFRLTPNANGHDAECGVCGERFHLSFL